MKRAIWTLALALAIPVAAQSRIDERRPAAADGAVEIRNAAGSIKVIGWNREEIQVTGTLGARADGLSFVSRPHRTRIEVLVRGNPNRVSSDLEIRVPAASRLQVASHAASIDVRDMSGSVKAESITGSIGVAGNSPEVEAESVSGEITIAAPAQRVRASAVNAGITIRGAGGVVEAETVNGRLEVQGGAFQEARFQTVNGALRFEGELRPGATLDVETVNGPIELRLPAGLGADFSISSFGGEVDSDFEIKLGPGSVRGRGQRHDGHEKELHFTTGGGGAKVAITTLNGNITLRKR